MFEQIESFLAVDENGNEYQLIVYQEFKSVSTRGGTRKVGGLKTVKTADGDSVTVLDDETYELDNGFSVHILRKLK